jgi:hypothetical protein
VLFFCSEELIVLENSWNEMGVRNEIVIPSNEQGALKQPWQRHALSRQEARTEGEATFFL